MLTAAFRHRLATVTRPSPVCRASVWSVGSRLNFHSSTGNRNEATSSDALSNNDDAKKVALQLLEKVPGKNKAYNFLVGTSTAALLFGYEIIPYTADILYMVPFSAAVMFGYKQLRPVLSGLVTTVEKEEEKFWTDAKIKAEARLEQDIHAITGSGITDLVKITEDIYEFSKEVATLEAQAFEHEQKLAYYTKAKQILDDWVRHETAVREREQKRIAEEVIAKVMVSLKDPKFQDRYLDSCLADVERALA